MVTTEQWDLFVDGVRNDLTNELVRVCPVDKGFLRETIDVKVKGNELIIIMADYGLYVEMGTAPHIIRPKNKKALAFAKFGGRRVQHDDGKVSTEFKFGGKKHLTDAVFAKEVHHPGTKAQPFIRNTFYHKLPAIVDVNAERHIPELVGQIKVSYT